MKTPPPYWKVKASPIVLEWAKQYHRPILKIDAYWASCTKDGVYMYEEGSPRDVEQKDLPILTQDQFKKHFYDPWKAGQNIDNATLYQDKTGDVHVIKKRTRTDSKRITLAKHNRITAEMQRQCDYLQSLKQADQDRIAQLEADRTQQHQQIVNLTDQKSALVQQVNKKDAILNEKQKYIHAVEQKFTNCANALAKAEQDANQRDKAHTTELNYLLDSRNLWRVLAFGFAFASALLGIAMLIGG